MSISETLYNNLLEQHKQKYLRREYKNIGMCSLAEVNRCVDGYTEETAKALLKMILFDRR